MCYVNTADCNSSLFRRMYIILLELIWKQSLKSNSGTWYKNERTVVLRFFPPVELLLIYKRLS